jgi:hypothetical protein
MKHALRAVLCLAWCLLGGSVSAQGVTTTSFQGMMNNIIRGTPGITNIPINGAVRSTATGSVGVAVRGASIPVATSVAADIGFGAIAKGAAKVGLRALPWVGTAIVLNDITDAVKGAGIIPCPPPDFFCKKGGLYIGFPVAQFQYSGSAGASGWYESQSDACQRYVALRSSTPQVDGYMLAYRFDMVTAAPEWACKYHNEPRYNADGTVATTRSDFSLPLQTQYYCAATGQTSTSTFECNSNKSAGPATEEDINVEIAKKLNADRDWAVATKAKMDAVTAANPGLAPAIDTTQAPLTVTAPAVSSPSVVTATEQISNPDGTTSTNTTREETRVTPQIGTPATVGNPQVTFPSTTTQTTTVTNNTTNQTTVTVSNITNPLPVAEPLKPQDMPTDYNREKTQQQILNALTTPITDEAPTGTTDLDAVKVQRDAGNTAIGNITEGSTGLKAWLPTINTSACVNPQVPSPISGTLVPVPICDSVNLFAKFISAVISVFALYGCIREVQAAIKA